MFKLIILSIILIAANVYAKEVWFGITGINRQNREMNHTGFYTESNAFLQACKKNPNRECHRYINGNTSLAAESGKANAPQIIGENSGTPTANRGASNSVVLRQITTTIANASAGDRIVISLSNHGGPGWDRGGRDLSCIFVQHGQKICDSDLARIIGDLPQRKGFQVAIVADGCFSGGFNKLSSRNVCVATTADQQRAGYGTRFWSSVAERSPATLADAGAVYNNGGNPYDNTMLASQYMDTEGCHESQRVLNRAPITDLLSESPFKFSNDQLCSRNSGYRQLNELTYSMSLIKKNLSDQNNVRRICAVSAEWCAVIRRISANQAAFSQSQEYASIMAGISALQGRMNARIAQLYAGRSKAEVREVSKFINYGDAAGLSRLSAARQAALRPNLASYTEFAESNKAEIDRLFARMSQLTRDWQASPIASDLRNLATCLSTPMGVNATGELIKELETRARTTRRRLNFTEQNKQDARQCEQSFRL